MDIRLIDSDLASLETPLLALPVPRGGPFSDAVARLDADHLGGALGRALADGDLRGADDEALLVYAVGEGGPRRVVALGVGKVEEINSETLRRWAGRAVRQAERLRLTGLALRLEVPSGIEPEVAAQATAEAVALAAWEFRELKGKGTDPDASPPIVTSATVQSDADGQAVERGLAAGRAIAAGQNLARTLQMRPGNLATPTHLGEEAEALGREWGLKVDVMGPDRLRQERMHAILAVAQGSDEEPRLLVMEYRGGGDAKPLVLVGKGLTFDAGGISIKPASGMESMKFDMSGGAAVLGAMRAIAELRPALNVVAIIPSSENLLGGRAMKPGDIIQTRAGKTVEVINTDAEGRLILADALDYARSFDPAAVVDCATLTGACVVALGGHAAAVLGTDDALVQELREAGDRSGERCWPLPLFKEYRKQLESVAADMQNVGGREAGAITAAWFLREFAGDAPWAHLDIAGTAYGDAPRPYQRKGGFGFPVRLLVDWVRSRAG
jgi:leucyl aminopeptidase